MRLLITGGTGFIGCHLTKKLEDENHEVFIACRNGSIVPAGYEKKHHVFNESVESDCLFFKEMHFDGVIHLATLYLSTHDVNDVQNLISANVFFGAYILDLAHHAGVRWFINTGTFWQHFENQVYLPSNLYAATKQAFETIAQYYISLQSIEFVTLELSDTFGLLDTRKKLMSLLKQAVNEGTSLDMSAGEQEIDMLYIDDVVDAFICTIELLGERKLNGKKFSLHAQKILKLKDLVKIIEQVTRKKLRINWGEIPYRKREIMETWKGGDKLPNWEAKISLEDGIRKYFD